MQDTHPETHPDPVDAPTAPAAETNGNAQGVSVMDGIRAIRAQRIADDVRQLDLDVPHYDARLAIIYRYPEKGYERAMKAIEREQRGERLDGPCDFLVECCAAVVGRDAEGGLIDPFTNGPLAEGQLPENPMRFDTRLAEALQIDVPPEVKQRARFIVRQVFSPRGAATGVYDGDLAIISQSNVVFAWLNGAELRIEEDAAGE
jgi:hypothetical protein